MKNSPSGSGVRAALLACATACAFTSAHAQNGTWTGTTSPGLWSDSANWAGGVIATGAGNTANFSTIDIPDGTFIAALDTPRTIGSISFGDNDTSSAGFWVIDNNVDPLNILTLDGSPVITVNALGTDALAEISAQITGTAGLTKAGPGTLTLSGPNTYSGTTTVNAGILNLSNATAIGTSTLTISGGNIGNPVGAVTLTNNNAQNWNSNFSYTGPGNLALGAGAVSIPSAITLTSNSGSLNVGGVITGAGNFTKDGSGEVLLSGLNAATFTGPMTLKGGLLRIRGNLASSAAGGALNQEPIGPATKTITFEGGSLMLNGATGSNGPTVVGFTNPLVVPAGQTGAVFTMQRGDFNSTITGSGSLNVICNYVRGNMNGNWTGFTGTVTASSAGTGNSEWRLNGTNMLHAGLSLHVTNAGVFQIFNPPNNAVGTTHAIGKLSGTSSAFMGGSTVNGRFVNWQVGALNQDSEYAGIIGNSTGAARLYKVGTGTLTLSGPNTYTGDTQLNAGTLKVGNGATGSLAATNVITTAGTTLVFDRDNSADSAYPGILSGPGTVIKRGNGRVNFNGINTYTAGTLIEGGTIGINSTASLGDAAGTVSFTVSNGGIIATAPGIVSSRNFSVASGITASFGAATAADSYEITSPISGAGALAVNGSGVLTLSGANTYGGSTTISSGTLVAANASGSATSTGALSLASGATLGGSGSISGATTTASGSHLRPGAITPTSTAVGTLTTGSLALAGGTTLHAEFTDSTVYDKIVVSNTNGLTAAASLANPVMVDLRVANSTAKWTTPGTYDLIQFSGSFTGNANDLFEVDPASQQAGLTYTFSVAGSSIRLTVGGALPSIWNVDAAGNWSLAGNWLNGAPNGVGATATFGSTITGPRTVTLDASRTAGILQFNNANSYTIIGSTPVLTLDQSTGSSEINILQGDHTIAAKLALTDPLLVTLANAGDSIALLGDISGAGSITKSSPGDLSLGGSNTFAGAVNFSNGLLTFGNNSLGSGSLTLNAATLAWSPSNTQDISNRPITFGDSAVTFLMDSNVTLANNFGLTGLAPFSKDGGGTLTLAADTTFLGNVSVLNGALTLGNGGTTGSVLGDVALGAGTTLTVNRSDSPLVGNLITGAGDLVLTGAGDKALSRANTFTGTTTISGGTLVLLEALALQNSTLLYNNGGGTLDFDNLFAATIGALEGNKDLALDNIFTTPVALTAGGNGATTSYTGILSGSGAFVKAGTGTLSLSGAHSFSGSTAVNGGTLYLEPTAVLNNSAINVGATGRLVIDGGTITSVGTGNVANSPAGPATFELVAGSASFPAGLNGTGNSANNYLISAIGGTLTASSMSIGRGGLIYTAEPVEGSTGIGFYVNGADVDIAGGFSMGVTSGANSSVSARIDSGSLDIGGPIVVGLNNGGRWSVIDVNGGTFTSSDAASGITLGGPLQGNAALLARSGVASVERIQFGQGAIAGTSTVNVMNIGELYVGAGGMVLGSTAPGFVATLKLSGGTLGAKAPWSTALPVATSGNFTVKAADASGTANNITFTGTLSGTGNLDKTGAGTLALNGGYSHTGTTTVSLGTLTLPTATLSDTATVEVKTGGTLNLTHGQQDTVAAFLVNGTAQGTGIFTSVTHPGLITGSGSLRVVSDPFAGWISGYPTLTGPDADKTADPDRDGLSNFEEFALNENPTLSAASGKIRSRIEAVAGNQALVITLPVRNGATFDNLPGPAADATIDKVIYTIRGGNNLSVFDQGVSEIVASTAGMPALDTGWTYHSFRLDGNIGGGTPRGPKGFIDIQITESP